MDYQFTINNQTGESVWVNATNEDASDWTNAKDPQTVIQNAEIQTIPHTFLLSGKMGYSDPWFVTEIKGKNDVLIASLYTKLDGNPLDNERVINDKNNSVNEQYIITRDYHDKDKYSYIITQK